jgi:hypothetical protein
MCTGMITQQSVIMLALYYSTSPLPCLKNLGNCNFFHGATFLNGVERPCKGLGGGQGQDWLLEVGQLYLLVR